MKHLNDDLKDFKTDMTRGEGSGDHYFFPAIPSRIIEIRFHTKIRFLGCLEVPGFHLIMWSHQLCNRLKLGCDN